MTQPTLERFLDDVKHHELTIHQNNGVYRHLTLEKSGGCYHSFNITTFPHYLVITGNMGALIFSQSHYDLFDFFRNDDLKINPDDWAKQIESTSYEAKINSYSEFDIDETKKVARKYLDDYLKNIALSHDEKANLLAEFNRKILCAGDEWKIVDAIRNFELDNFDFEYFCWEDCRTHRYDYIWLCYAIVWGIKKFDEVTKLKTKELAKEHALARERLKKKQKEEQAEMDKARELAWKDVQIACGHHKMNLTVGEICNDYGFFMQGWSYAIRYRTQE